jgi:hypothetical protein
MRKLLAIYCTAAVVLLAGCDSEDAVLPTENVFTGTWNLGTVNGAALPYTVQSTPKIELVGDQLVVSANGTFAVATQLRITNGTTITTQTVPDGGTYSVNGTSATFIFNGGTTGAATVSGNTLTVAEPGVSLVYQKQ